MGQFGKGKQKYFNLGLRGQIGINKQCRPKEDATEHGI